MKKFEYEETELNYCTLYNREQHMKVQGNLGWELVGVVTNGWTGSAYRFFWKREVIHKFGGREWDCPHSPTGVCDYQQNDGSYNYDSCLYCGQPDERK